MLQSTRALGRPLDSTLRLQAGVLIFKDQAAKGKPTILDPVEPAADIIGSAVWPHGGVAMPSSINFR